VEKTFSIMNKRFASRLGLCCLFALALGSTNLYAQDAVNAAPSDLASIEAARPPIDALPILTETEKSLLLQAINQPSIRLDQFRDKYRHPAETLTFFGIKPSDKVIEIWPGQGWYTTILAPYLKLGGGTLVAAHFDTTTTNSKLVKDMVGAFHDKYATDIGKYGNVTMSSFGPRSKDIAPENSVDAVLTFRNIHNWMNQGWADKAFADFYRALKPGGILGIEEHRADSDGTQDPLAADGYVREDFIIDIAQEAGFVLVGKSEINANPKDSKDHPFGVWTLPPVSRTAPIGQPANQNFDQSKFLAIGESDRMTLLFRKPYPDPVALAKDNSKKSIQPVKMVFGGAKSNVKKSAEVVKPLETAKPVEINMAQNTNNGASSSNPIISAPTPIIASVPNVTPVPIAIAKTAPDKTKDKTSISKSVPTPVTPVKVDKVGDKDIALTPMRIGSQTPAVASTPNIAPIVPPVTSAPPVNPVQEAKTIPDFTIPDWVDKPKTEEKPNPDAVKILANDISAPIASTPKVATTTKKAETIKPEVKKPEVKKIDAIVSKAAPKPTPLPPKSQATKTPDKAKAEKPKVVVSEKTNNTSKPKWENKDAKTSTSKKAEVNTKAIAKPTKPENKPKTTVTDKKTDVKKDVKKPVAKVETKPVAKPAAKPVAKVATKPAVKPATKPVTKPAAKPKSANSPDWVNPKKK
jgi:predicted methyltransferase